MVVIANQGSDRSRLSPTAVRGCLQALRVPLAVWSADGVSVDGEWGPAVDVSSVNALGRASRRLVEELDGQWTVWIKGRHLPSDVELAANRWGYELAGLSVR